MSRPAPQCMPPLGPLSGDLSIGMMPPGLTSAAAACPACVFLALSAVLSEALTGVSMFFASAPSTVYRDETESSTGVTCCAPEDCMKSAATGTFVSGMMLTTLVMEAGILESKYLLSRVPRPDQRLQLLPAVRARAQD